MVAGGDVAGLIAFGKQHTLDPAMPDTRSLYAAQLTRTGGARPYPPGRNAACWCGSGRKYKKCCGVGR
jgi:uncharacterized protein YecA (UPF0149 family)